MNIPRAFARFLIRFYQIFLSGFFGGNCRFHPSCSCYAEEAYTKHKPLFATYIVMNRVLSCRPFGRSGYDPVPEESLHE